MKYISVEQMNEACDNEYKENYAHGGYCHEQSFRFGFQEGIEFAERMLVDALDNDLYDELHKPQYPKTYEGCCKVLFPHSIELEKVLTSGYNCELLKKFGELLICRDAYWKIAGEEMGLGKPWRPDWKHLNRKSYCIYNSKNNIVKNVIYAENKILAFPTAEMRDAFYENFKDLIEQCKELL